MRGGRLFPSVAVEGAPALVECDCCTDATSVQSGVTTPWLDGNGQRDGATQALMGLDSLTSGQPQCRGALRPSRGDGRSCRVLFVDEGRAGLG